MNATAWTVLAPLLLALAPPAAAQAPSAALFQQVLDAHLQTLRTPGFTNRTVLFEEVRPGRPAGGTFPFLVTATVHDYGPGYPPNRYYGQTCVGRMEGWRFDLRQDAFGTWVVQGRMTVSHTECRDNPAEGVSAIPLAGLAGKPADRQRPAAAAAPTPAPRPAALYLGEYACYGTGGRLMAGLGFQLLRGGRYHDVDGERGGTWSHDARAATLSFRGGFLDGRVARGVSDAGFQLSSTVSCEPWR